LLAMDVPQTITPTTGPVKCSAFIYNTITLSQEEIDKVMNGKRFIHFRAVVRYKHLFSEDFQTTSYRAFWGWSLYGSFMTGQWIKCGNEDDNRET
jgi:hypothetical protein